MASSSRLGTDCMVNVLDTAWYSIAYNMGRPDLTSMRECETDQTT